MSFYIDQENDLVVVVRWIAGRGRLNGFIEKVLASIESPVPTDTGPSR
jgi:hypothetical protein